jgi:hypothetical protein
MYLRPLAFVLALIITACTQDSPVIPDVVQNLDKELTQKLIDAAPNGKFSQ